RAESLEFVFLVKRLPIAAAESDHSREPPRRFQRRDATEKLRGDIAVRTEENIVGTLVEHDWVSCGGKCVCLARQQRNQRGLGQHRKTLRGYGSKQGRFIAEGEQSAFAGRSRFHERGEHDACCVRKVALSGKFRTEIRQRFDRSQQPPKIVFLNAHAGGSDYVEQIEINTQKN